MYIDKRTLYIIIALILLLNVFTGERTIEGIILSLPGVIVAMTFHEFAHAFVATKLGDDTPRLQGRLNLNPINHLDPIGLICLVFLGFGWGKPVQINPRNFDGKYSLAKAEAMVSAAGPIMNFIIAFLGCVALIITLQTAVVTKTIEIIIVIIKSIIVVNIGLGVFNLIPVYPLDGSKILSMFLSYKAREWLMENQEILTIILLLVVFWTDFISIIIIICRERNDVDGIKHCRNVYIVT